MHPAIGKHRASIAVICRRYGVSRLEVFGAAIYGNDAAGSDLGGLRGGLPAFLGCTAGVAHGAKPYGPVLQPWPLRRREWHRSGMNGNVPLARLFALLAPLCRASP